MKLLLSICVLASSAFLSACNTVITANDGRRVVIEQDPGASFADSQLIATKTCVQAGRSGAKHVFSANKATFLAPGNGVQLQSFDCF